MWLTGWNFVRPIIIKNYTECDLENYTCFLHFDHKRLVDLGKSLPQGQDIRIMDEQESEIPRVIQEWNTRRAKLIFKCDLPSSDEVVLYMFYGNQNANDPGYTLDDVYICYDDFDAFDTEKWDLDGADAYRVLNSKLEVKLDTSNSASLSPKFTIPEYREISCALSVPDPPTGGGTSKSGLNRLKYVVERENGELNKYFSCECGLYTKYLALDLYIAKLRHRTWCVGNIGFGNDVPICSTRCSDVITFEKDYSDIAWFSISYYIARAFTFPEPDCLLGIESNEIEPQPNYPGAAIIGNEFSGFVVLKGAKIERITRRSKNETRREYTLKAKLLDVTAKDDVEKLKRMEKAKVPVLFKFDEEEIPCEVKSVRIAPLPGFRHLYFEVSMTLGEKNDR